MELVAAKSSLVFNIIEEEESPSDASVQSMLSYLRHIDHGYNRFVKQLITAAPATRRVLIDELNDSTIGAFICIRICTMLCVIFYYII